MLKAYEDLMNDAIQGFLRSICIRYTWQVPALGGRIDFVGVRPSYEVIGIEAKVSRWLDALKQAKRDQLIVDKAYVAVPSPVAEQAAKKREIFKDSGVGLISVGRTTKVLIRATGICPAIPDLRGYLLDHTRKRRRRSRLRVRERINKYNSIVDHSPEANQCQRMNGHQNSD